MLSKSLRIYQNSSSQRQQLPHISFFFSFDYYTACNMQHKLLCIISLPNPKCMFVYSNKKLDRYVFFFCIIPATCINSSYIPLICIILTNVKCKIYFLNRFAYKMCLHSHTGINTNANRLVWQTCMGNSSWSS